MTCSQISDLIFDYLGWNKGYGTTTACYIISKDKLTSVFDLLDIDKYEISEKFLSHLSNHEMYAENDDMCELLFVLDYIEDDIDLYEELAGVLAKVNLKICLNLFIEVCF